MSAVISTSNLSTFFEMMGKKICEGFDDKFEVQKIIYLAQEYGIPIGYDFEWYLRGPYCNQVAKDAHQMVDTPEESKEIQLDEKKVAEFGKILEPYINNTEWLEIASSLIYLRNEQHPGRELDEVVSSIFEDLYFGYSGFSDHMTYSVFKDILRLGLIK